jgi:acyl-coenzyme A synthetase/AMP-(fatty) acid ligase
MLGYVNHEPTVPDGWYTTSDIGVRRPDGSVSVLGRNSDAIKRGGETIAPAVVESLVEKHPDIDRARVCGIPHESLGEQICVAVITARGESAADELLRELRVMLPTNLTPSKLRIVDSFLGSTEGKIRRSDLRPLFAE